ncbi:MAG: SDR family NAD(P)-dependent oxidoreductase [Micromonosporaceae bacterium]|nr:SDR family NAD(P)-dependent oxidoreductase [Micromonosporaceae bacterium]
MRISGSVALVTGASSGIGYQSALRLAAAGARVLVHGRAGGPLAELAQRTGGTAIVADLAEPDGASRLAQAALDAADRVDILVNNAGQGWAGQFSTMDTAGADRLIAVNLRAPVALTRLLLPQMAQRGDGYLMFVTSIAGRMGVAGEAVYSATKAGLDVFAESLRLELTGTGVRVGVLVPGVVQTPFFDRRGAPYQRDRPRPIPAEVVAAALVRAVATGQAERFAPRWMRLPVAIRVAVPGLYRRLAARYGGGG